MTMSRSAKIAGFQAAADAAGLRKSAKVIDGGPLDEYGDSVIADVGRAIGTRLAAGTARATGIVALNDLMAMGVMAGARDGGLRVPRDLSVVGIDGLFLFALSDPPLTTVQLPVREMARAMVDEAMHPGPDAGADEHELVFAPAGLVERGSVAAPARSARAAARR
jgi:DNA-binding LacI/PurR family transcriptional regulator